MEIYNNVISELPDVVRDVLVYIFILCLGNRQAGLLSLGVARVT